MKKIRNRLLKKAYNYSRRKNRSNTTVKAVNSELLPRLVVNKSNKFNYAQIIDLSGTVLVAANDVKTANGNKTENAIELGKTVAKLALEKGISKVVFDRNGFIFHGRVKAIADGAREAGLSI